MGRICICPSGINVDVLGTAQESQFDSVSRVVNTSNCPAVHLYLRCLCVYVTAELLYMLFST